MKSVGLIWFVKCPTSKLTIVSEMADSVKVLPDDEPTILSLLSLTNWCVFHYLTTCFNTKWKHERNLCIKKRKKVDDVGAVILVVLKNNFRLKVARLDLLILLAHSWCQNNHDYCLHFSLPSLSVLSHSFQSSSPSGHKLVWREWSVQWSEERERETSYWVPGYKSFWWSGVERVKRKDDEFGLCCWLKSLFTKVPFVKLIWRRGFFPSSPQLPSFPVHVSWLPKLQFLSFVFHFSSTLVSPVLLSSSLVLCQM